VTREYTSSASLLPPLPICAASHDATDAIMLT
jgi:hypothetical protein